MLRIKETSNNYIVSTNKDDKNERKCGRMVCCLYVRPRGDRVTTIGALADEALPRTTGVRRPPVRTRRMSLHVNQWRRLMFNIVGRQFLRPPVKSLPYPILNYCGMFRRLYAVCDATTKSRRFRSVIDLPID